MKKIAFVVWAMVLPSIAAAGPWHPGGSYVASNATSLRAVYPTEAGLAFLLETPDSNLSSCNGGRRFQIHIDHPNYEVLSSAMMMAFAAGQRVVIKLEPLSEPTCWPNVNRFIVYE